MNGYSKLRLVNKSGSIDFSELSSTKTLSHQTQKVHENIPPSPSESDNQDTDTVNYQDHDQSPPKQQQQQQDEDEHQAACSNEKTSSVGAKYLSKNHSVSSATSSQRITATKSGIQSALRRAFSMRRSSTSSVSHEKYCRIHDQCVAILLDDDDVDEDVFEAMEDNITSANSIGYQEKKKFASKSRILKACKRILGF